MRWTDIYEIAIELEESYPEKDNINLRFTLIPGFKLIHYTQK